jgi:pyruvate carboxylase
VARVQPGDKVAAGDVVATIEAMKMEANITTPIEGTVTRIAVTGPAQAQAGDLLLVIA